MATSEGNMWNFSRPEAQSGRVLAARPPSEGLLLGLLCVSYRPTEVVETRSSHTVDVRRSQPTFRVLELPVSDAFLHRPPFTCESSGPLLYREQTRPLVILLLFGLGDFGGQVQRLLEEIHQRLFRQQRRQDLSVAGRPLAFRRRTPVTGAHSFDRGPRAGREVAGLADLQHETGYLGDGLEELVLLRVAVEHAVERLAELDELTLRRTGWRDFDYIICLFVHARIKTKQRLSANTEAKEAFK